MDKKDLINEAKIEVEKIVFHGKDGEKMSFWNMENTAIIILHLYKFVKSS